MHLNELAKYFTIYLQNKTQFYEKDFLFLIHRQKSLITTGDVNA